ncbi:MAG TPA: histidine kinase, partial [Dehalococcoidia bacterium]|nr:histidine kinase [Dehalococcoidia bacterium]
MATAALDDARLNRLGWWRRLVALPPEQVDRLLAAAVGTLILVAIAFTHDPGTRRPDVLAYLLGVAGAALLLFRRRWPLVIVPATLLPVIIYHDRNYPGPGPVIAFGVALYSFAVSGWRLRSLLAGVVVIATLLFNRAVAGRSQLLSSTTALYAAVTVAVLLLGDTVRSRRALRAEIEERIRRVAAEREAEALRRMTEERLRIARELHDVMAHTIAVIAVQAGVAADMLDTRPEQAKSALELIRQASRDARRELQATLDVLRQEG